MRFINKTLLIIVSLFVALGAFIFGYSLCSISMMAENITQHNKLSEEDKHFQLSVITTLLPFGAFLGTFLTNPMVDIFGERRSMVYIDIFAIIVITYQSYFYDVYSLYATRFCLGLYLGVSGTIIPGYLVSISPPELTGLIGSFNQLLITIGVAMGYRFG